MQQLLETEGVTIKNDKITNRKDVFWYSMKEIVFDE
jgi:hypothetical protein